MIGNPPSLVRLVSVLALAGIAMATGSGAMAQAAQVADDASAIGDDPICTDRPTKANNACSVPKGVVQIEFEAINWSRLSAGGARSDAFAYASPTIKLGVSDSSDVQLTLTPLVEVRNRVAGRTASQTGFGDVFLRFKQRITAKDARIELALIPYIKAPTAKTGIGNGEWEGGISVPIQYALTDRWSLTVNPQLSLLAGSVDPDERHLELQTVLNLGYQLTTRTSVAAEVWTSQNWDPSGTVRQYSADLAIAHLLNDDLQLDGGVNFGLNQVTPDVQVYAGISARF